MTIGSRDVGTLMDSARTYRPQSGAALVGRELGRYKRQQPWVKLALQVGEISWCWLHILLEWTQERGNAGSRSRTGLIGNSGLPKGIALLMTLKVPVSDNQHTTIISAYAVTMTSQMKSKQSSTMLWIVLFLQHPHYKLIILGDLNARVGTDYQA